MTPESGAVEISRPQSFAIKGVLLPLTLVDVRSGSADVIRKELSVKVESAPKFFSGGAVVLSFESFDVLEPESVTTIVEVSRELGFRLAGLKGDAKAVAEVAKGLGLAHFPSGRVRAVEPAIENEQPVQKPAKVTAANNRTVTRPVRSGQQIFSDGDLLVLAPVSAGAELLAVGNIHIYAPMRGRALAGVQGDETARIFCMSQEAELVSIAGHFMIDENLQQACWKQAAQVYFDGDELRVEPITTSFA